MTTLKHDGWVIEFDSDHPNRVFVRREDKPGNIEIKADDEGYVADIWTASYLDCESSAAALYADLNDEDTDTHERAPQVLRTFIVGSKAYELCLFPKERNQVELIGPGNATLLEFSHDLLVFDQFGKIGDIHLETIFGKPNFVYYGGPLRTRIPAECEDIHEFQEAIAKRWLSNQASHRYDQEQA